MMYEIEKIHPFDPHLTSGLERWLTLQCSKAFNATDYNGTKQNDDMGVQTLTKNLNHPKHYVKRNGGKKIKQEYPTNGERKGSRGM